MPAEWVNFDGGALVPAKGAGKPKVVDSARGETPVKKPADPPDYGSEYKILKGPDTKLPKERLVESRGVGAQELASRVKYATWDGVPEVSADADQLKALKKAGYISQAEFNESSSRLGEEGATNVGVHVHKAPEGQRMIVRASAAALAKSKWADGPAPRPSTSNPPQLPTDVKLGEKMKVALEASEGGNGSLDTVVATFPEPKKNKDGNVEPVKWRLELKCKGWQRSIGVMAETPTASFKIAGAAEKQIEVRGATVGFDGKCSHWTVWKRVENPVRITNESSPAAVAPPSIQPDSEALAQEAAAARVQAAAAEAEAARARADADAAVQAARAELSAVQQSAADAAALAAEAAATKARSEAQEQMSGLLEEMRSDFEARLQQMQAQLEAARHQATDELREMREMLREAQARADASETREKALLQAMQEAGQGPGQGNGGPSVE